MHSHAQKDLKRVMVHMMNENTPLQRLGLNSMRGDGIWFSLQLNNLRKHPLSLSLAEAA